MKFPYTAQLLSAEFKTPPFDHQMREFEQYAEAPARAKAWQMRSGKSKAVIDKACHLFKAGLINGVLVFAPNGVHANWIERELPIHGWDSIAFDSIIWRTKNAGAKGGNRLGRKAREDWEIEQAVWWQKMHHTILKNDPAFFWMAVNSESMTRPDTRRAVARFLKHRRCYMVLDESDDFGTPGSQRTKMGRAQALRAPFKEILSGTMLEGNLLAAWSQFEMLKRGALGFDKYSDFKHHFGVYENQTYGARAFPKLVGFKNTDELRERIAKFTSVVLRADANLPELEPETRPVVPTLEQLDAYEQLKESFLLGLETGEISVGERAPRFMKLQQVFSGFVKDEYGKTIRIPGENPRLDMLAHDVYLAPGKVIIWCQFQFDIDEVATRLMLDGHGVVQYHGRISGVAKAQALHDFKTQPMKKVKALVGHVQAGGRGLDMSEATGVYNYSHTFKARLRSQAGERATKVGGGNVRFVDYVAPGPDNYILKVTNGRRDIADSISGSGLRELLQALNI